jgi:hypothetical protein
MQYSEQAFRRRQRKIKNELECGNTAFYADEKIPGRDCFCEPTELCDVIAEHHWQNERVESIEVMLFQ